ncbi:D-arabinose 1-dehydrogenase-like Zn-dependent alcohol dehydrogenase [Bradyrhizobium japonicum]
MKRIQYYSYGGPETMKLEAFELKAPGTGEVAVKVEFAAINPIDWKVRNGYLKMVTGKKFPRAMGSDFSGIVTAVGAGVTCFKIGDPVFGMAQIKHGGALGEAVIAPQTFVARSPDSVSFEDAACLATPGVTAWNGLVDKAALKSGSQVFVNGCTGAVGEATVQLAKMFGATVAGTCSAQAMQRGPRCLLPFFGRIRARLGLCRRANDYSTSCRSCGGTAPRCRATTLRLRRVCRCERFIATSPTCRAWAHKSTVSLALAMSCNPASSFLP